MAAVRRDTAAHLASRHKAAARARTVRRRRAVVTLATIVVVAGIVAACNAASSAGSKHKGNGPTTTNTRPTSSAAGTTTTTLPASFEVGLHTFNWDEVGTGITHVSPTGTALPGRILTTEIRYPTLAGSSSAETPNAQPARVGGPYPVIVFAHGFETQPLDYEGLLDAWVKAGFVVVSPIFPDESLQAVTAAGGMSSPTIADNLETDVYNEPGDIVYVLKQLASIGDDPWGSHLAAVMNLSDVGLAGQSDGANVVAALSYASGLSSTYTKLASAPKAVAVMSGNAWSSLPSGQIATYSATASSPPLLQIQSDADGCVSPAEATDLFSQLQGGLGAKWFLTLLGAAHLAPYQGVAPWAPVVDAVTTRFFELELDWRPASSSAGAIEAAGTVKGTGQISTTVNEATMPQVSPIQGC
jgi:hypothetical protein